MCAQKLGQPSESGHLAIASRRRTSVRRRPASSMSAIDSRKAWLKKTLVQSAGGMSAGAESGRSARIGGARLIKPTFRPDTSRSGLWPDSGRTFSRINVGLLKWWNCTSYPNKQLENKTSGEGTSASKLGVTTYRE
jgi:hypothetical protein